MLGVLYVTLCSFFGYKKYEIHKYRIFSDLLRIIIIQEKDHLKVTTESCQHSCISNVINAYTKIQSCNFIANMYSANM